MSYSCCSIHLFIYTMNRLLKRYLKITYAEHNQITAMIRIHIYALKLTNENIRQNKPRNWPSCSFERFFRNCTSSSPVCDLVCDINSTGISMLSQSGS